MKQKKKLERTLTTLGCLVEFLDMDSTLIESMSEAFWQELHDCFEASYFLKLIMSFFFGTTAKVALDQQDLYCRLHVLVYLVSRCPGLAPLLGPVEGVYRSVQDLMRDMHEIGQELEEDGLAAVDDASNASNDVDQEKPAEVEAGSGLARTEEETKEEPPGMRGAAELSDLPLPS